jgi:hypothetical protein
MAERDISYLGSSKHCVLYKSRRCELVSGQDLDRGSTRYSICGCSHGYMSLPRQLVTTCDRRLATINFRLVQLRASVHSTTSMTILHSLRHSVCTVCASLLARPLSTALSLDPMIRETPSPRQSIRSCMSS